MIEGLKVTVLGTELRDLAMQRANPTMINPVRYSRRSGSISQASANISPGPKTQFKNRELLAPLRPLDIALEEHGGILAVEYVEHVNDPLRLGLIRFRAVRCRADHRPL